MRMDEWAAWEWRVMNTQMQDHAGTQVALGTLAAMVNSALGGDKDATPIDFVPWLKTEQDLIEDEKKDIERKVNQKRANLTRGMGI